MKQRMLLGIFGFAALMPFSAAAQLPIEPSAKALELAKLLGPSELFQKPPMPAEWELKRTLNSIYSTTLMSKGEPCDEKDLRCSKVANEIAGRAIKDRQEHQKKIAEYAYAVHFQKTMSDEDIDSAIKYLKTEPGRRFSISLFSVLDGNDVMQSLSPGGSLFNKATTWSMTPYLEEFYDRTVGLPRTTRRLPPPPPRPPVAKRPEGQ